VSDWVLATEESGYTRHFDAAALPVAFGSGDGDDLKLADVNGTIQIGMLDQVFFVQPLRDTRNVRVNGEVLRGSRRLEDGDLIAFDTARLNIRLGDGRVRIGIAAQVTAGDTAPPDFGATAQRASGELTVAPIAFKPNLKRADDDARPRLSRGSMIVAAAFAVLGLVGWFAFTGKSVHFEISPLPDRFELPETLLKFSLGDRYMLREGSHRVVAELEGYYPIDEVIEVGALGDQTFDFEFVRLPGLVSFRTEPEAQAEVSLDGAVVGSTPLVDLEVRPGRHQVQFVAERYLTEVTTIDVDGAGRRQETTVALTPSWAPVTLSTEPAGAEVSVDGRVLGTTPVTLELTAGERLLEVSLDGYNRWQREIRVFADEPQVIEPIVLSLADGRLVIASEPADAAVSVDGEYRGRTPVDLRLPPNVEHRVALARPGYQSFNRNLRLGPGGVVQIDVDLEPQLGTVEIVTRPEGARVLVGGEMQGTTPVALELMTVEQGIAIQLDGYAPVDATVTPREGYPQRLAYDLALLDAVTGDGYARIITTSLGQRLALIPAGRFQMGSSRSDPDRRLNEVLKTVELTKAFYLAEREMTNAEFRHCEPDHDSGEFAGQSLNGDDQPVVNVTIQEIYACLNQLSIENGLQPVYIEENGLLVPHRPLRDGYRLPTEAEFAWALRAAGRGDEAPLYFSWGDSLPPPDRFANIADQSAEDILPTVNVTYVDGFPVSAPVGSFRANAAGLFDMDGNVAEWVQDYYDATNRASTAMLTDPLGPVTGRSHLVRGPAWTSATVRQLRLSYRDYEDEARMDLGFRIARNLERAAGQEGE